MTLLNFLAHCEYKSIQKIQFVLTFIIFLEMVISTAQDLFFLQSSKITTKAFADTILALNSDGMSHVFILQNAGRQNNQLKLTNLTTNTPEEENHQESIFFPVIPGVNQILPYHNNGFFMSNQTHLFLLKDQVCVFG